MDILEREINNGKEESDGGNVKMEEEEKCDYIVNNNGSSNDNDGKKTSVVYMWGYLPGVSPEKSPILSPVPVRSPDAGGEFWKDVCGGGCGFAMAISESGKLMTWGSADDEGQSFSISGKHGETPEELPLPTEAPVVNAAAGWAHCVSVTEAGEVYAWGWKECVPSGKVILDTACGRSLPKENGQKQSSSPTEQVSPRCKVSNLTSPTISNPGNRKAGEEVVKRRRITTVKELPESPTSADEFFTMSPCLVTLGPGVRITAVATGGRHTVALSDVGQVWGWGYGGEGQLGLGSRVKMVPSPHLIPCFETPNSGKERPFTNSAAQVAKVAGSYVKGIACGGRHSAVVTDSGALLTFGWGLYGQCGQGSTNDLLRPTHVSSLSGVNVERIAMGLWHTLCVSTEGHVYAFGGNQFGQLGTGADQAETVPRLLDAMSLESRQAKVVSCGARHSAVITEDGQVLSWGWNKYGQLGLGDSIDRNIPSQVTIEGWLPKNIVCGWWHTLVLAETV